MGEYTHEKGLILTRTEVGSQVGVSKADLEVAAIRTMLAFEFGNLAALLRVLPAGHTPVDTRLRCSLDVGRCKWVLIAVDTGRSTILHRATIRVRCAAGCLPALSLQSFVGVVEREINSNAYCRVICQQMPEMS